MNEEMQKFFDEMWTEEEWDFLYQSDANEVALKAFKKGYEACLQIEDVKRQPVAQ